MIIMEIISLDFVSHILWCNTVYISSNLHETQVSIKYIAFLFNFNGSNKQDPLLELQPIMSVLDFTKTLTIT